MRTRVLAITTTYLIELPDEQFRMSEAMLTDDCDEPTESVIGVHGSVSPK